MALPGGVTLNQFKAILGTTRTDSDDLLTMYLEGAAGFAADFTRRVLIAEQTDEEPAVAKAFSVGSGTYLRLPDARGITTVDLDGTALSVGDYVTRHTPFSFTDTAVALAGLPSGGTTCTITARWGIVTLPATLCDAIYAHAARNYREKMALYADTVELGAGESGAALYSYFRQLPPRVQAIYSMYQVVVDRLGVG